VSLKHTIRKILRSTGHDIVRFGPGSGALASRIHRLRSLKVDTVLDVGANVGQFGQHLRQEAGYRGRIVSFEPLVAAYRVLQGRAGRDAAWQAFNYALGAADGKVEINVAANSHSSSILGALPALTGVEPDCRAVGKELISVRRLDSVFDEICADSRSVYMKIDTQGFEEQVIRGAERTLARVHTVQLEMSLVSLYDSEPLFGSLCELMAQRGFGLLALEPAFVDRATLQILQVDGIFHRLLTARPLRG
jgi:FkbM family methyltransferase